MAVAREYYVTIPRSSVSQSMECVYCLHISQSQALERKGPENLHQYCRSRALTGNSTQEQLNYSACVLALLGVLPM